MRSLIFLSALALWLDLNAPAAPINTTLALPLNPPIQGFATTNAFPGLAFSSPLALVTPPGETNRLFVIEQPGRIVVITNLTQPNRTVFLDIAARIRSGGEEGLLGLAFDPNYASNGYFYIFYTANATTSAGTGLHDRLSRFQVSPDDSNRVLPDSEVPLLLQYDQAPNHNGGNIVFGPDGYLYVGLGDEGGANDSYQNSQRIDKDFFSGILRIDVHSRSGNLAPNSHPSVAGNYLVPADNPFVGAMEFNGLSVDPTKVRTEFWAVGLRNPWRFSFDPSTGTLYCADVGQDAREEVDIIVRGGNYGWNYVEGTIPGPRKAPAGFQSIAPILNYPHGTSTNQGKSITGGVVYRGQRISSLVGAYVFGDYVSGNIWSVRYDGTKAAPMEWLTRDSSISAFGTDPRNGDVLFCNLSSGTIKRLTHASDSTGTPLPPSLADTGAFVNLQTLEPAANIIPYDINVPFWSDNARKQRWFTLTKVGSAVSFNRTNNYGFPEGAIWVKHFDLELTNGVASSARRLETRFIVRNARGVYGVTYRWDNLQTNAYLVADAGFDETFTVWDQGVARFQTWHYPGRAECLACHTAAGGYALGFNTAQLNRTTQRAGAAVDQISALSDAGYFDVPVNDRATLPALAAANDTSTSLEYRVRSYLEANCAQCHQPGSAGVGYFDARTITSTAAAGLIDGPLNDAKSDPNNRVVSPGHPEFSMLLTRIANNGPGRMPPLATTVLDTQSIALLSAWITNDLPSYLSFSAWQSNHFESTNAPNAAPDADPDQDGFGNMWEYLAGGNPIQADRPWHFEISVQPVTSVATVTFPWLANRNFVVQTADALESPIQWRPLDVPANRPHYPAQTTTATIQDTFAPGTNKFYRVIMNAP
jgi:glucose/arabinose dehydrogenase/mono/diheme cytochrome c family protein